MTGSQLDHSAELRRCFLDSPLTDESDSQTMVCLDQFRTSPNRVAEVREGAINVALVPKDEAEIVVGLGVVWIDGERFSVVRSGLSHPGKLPVG